MLFCLSARGLMLFYQNPKLIRLIPNKKEKVFLIEGDGRKVQRFRGSEGQRNKFTLCLCYSVPQNCFVPLLLCTPVPQNPSVTQTLLTYIPNYS